MNDRTFMQGIGYLIMAIGFTHTGEGRAVIILVLAFVVMAVSTLYEDATKKRKVQTRILRRNHELP